jgi:hypothetical protein
MQQSPSWHADGRYASQELSGLLRYPKVYYRIRKTLPEPDESNPYPHTLLS